MLQIHTEIIVNALDKVNVGILILNNDQRLIFLNKWIRRYAQLPEDNFAGRCFKEIFPEASSGRVYEAINSALTHNLASTLSQTLNKSPFSLFASPIDKQKGIRIQQAIAVVPLQIKDFSRHCLVQITDVTLSVSREKVLRNQSILLRAQSYFDALTGIANRRRFNEYLDDEFRRAKRASYPLSLLMIDVDHFKLYNDYYGHLAGDYSLQQVATTLSNVLQRPADLLARYGGEEFSAILPETNFEGAYKIAEAMIASINNLNLEHAQSPTAPYITVSIGAATKIPERNEEVSNIIKIADQALYHAKSMGRNKFIIAML